MSRDRDAIETDGHGYVILSDEDVDRIADRVVEKMEWREGAKAVDVLETVGAQALALLLETLTLYESAQCVGPTREELARVNEIRKLVGLAPAREYGE